ncbi:hypothetical protein F5Y15DRAFT_100338 [Xylariaceae sp. FL0016]|nr:hypothetical protein F5Y15DRAFT_100338 [Xylariaceae sp. FL0016]
MSSYAEKRNAMRRPGGSSPAASRALGIAIALLLLDSVIELSLISATVAWLNRVVTQRPFYFRSGADTYALSGVPSHLLVDQGHTSNGAAGTAFVLTGLGGVLALVLRSRAQYGSRGGFAAFSRGVYYLWLALNIPALLLTMGALGYVFTVTNANRHSIDATVAAGLDGSPYPLHTWTPQTWFDAVRKLDLTERRDEVQTHVNVIWGWQWNLIPLFLLQLFETMVAVWEFLGWRRQTQQMGYNTPGA